MIFFCSERPLLRKADIQIREMKNRELKGRNTPNTVEKLCFRTARKFLEIFRSPGARITNQFCGSEVRQDGFSWAFYYPLVSSVRNDAQNANKIVALFKTEFFNSIHPEAAVELE